MSRATSAGGRVAEGSGEDVHLGALLAAARVRGFQGRDLSRDDSLCATPKHFAGYAAVRAGMEYAEVDISEATLRETHIPPFAAAFAAGAGAVMASFTNVNGVPATANHALLTDLLRTTLHFAGPCVSDYDADLELIAHGFAANEADAARLAILAGTDMSMQSGLFIRHLPALVTTGAVPIARVDEAVRRVLALKERLGLFDRPFRSLDRTAERTRIATPATLALSRETARRSIVLLRNDGDVLPLSPTRRIALIGPLGEDRANLDGPWSFAGYRRQGIDLASGIRAAMPHPERLVVEPGSGIDGPLDGGIPRAIAAAHDADVVLLAIGEGAGMSGEANSRTAITVPASQQALADAVAATGKPVVVLLRHGRALALEGAVAAAPAILATWFLGCETGPAVADILFGHAEPSGRLPVSFPFATGQEPWSYDRPSTGRPPPPLPGEQGGTGRWRDAPDAARYPLRPWPGLLAVRAQRDRGAGADAGPDRDRLHAPQHGDTGQHRDRSALRPPARRQPRPADPPAQALRPADARGRTGTAIHARADAGGPRLRRCLRGVEGGIGHDRHLDRPQRRGPGIARDHRLIGLPRLTGVRTVPTLLSTQPVAS